MKKRIITLVFVFTAQLSFAQGNGVTRDDVVLLKSQINDRFGPLYELYDFVNVDSSIGNRRVAQGRVEDPYETLKGCYVFTVRGKIVGDSIDPPKGFIGVWKDAAILWTSDTLMRSFAVISPEVYGSMDLNNDGKVEILITWGEDGGEGHTVDYLWVFSWDGRQGIVENDYNENGRSVMSSIDQTFSVVDINGDGVLEINVDLRGTDYDVFGRATYSWNGQAYGRWPDTPEIPLSGFLPRDKLEIIVQASVERLTTGYRYQYLITNKPTSLQSLSEFWFTKRTESFSDWNGPAPSPWGFGPGAKSISGWTAEREMDVIKKSNKQSSLSVASKALPSVVSYYCQGYTDTSGEPDDLDLWYENVLVNSFRGLTLGPADPPDPFVPAAFLDTLLSYTRQSAELGWLAPLRGLGRHRDDDCDEDERPDDGITKNIEKRLQKAQKELSKGDSLKARKELEKLVKKLERIWKRSQEQEKKHKQEEKRDDLIMTSEAYALLKYNTEYLVERLLEKDRTPRKDKD